MRVRFHVSGWRRYDAGCEARLVAGVLKPGLAEVSDVELDVGSLERIEVVVLAPAEPAMQLVGGVQGVGGPE